MSYKLAHEHRVHSQHGEDGIIKTMTDAIVSPNRCFLEIGWGDGTQNMTRRLIEQGWSGVAIDGGHEPEIPVPANVQFRSLFITPQILEQAFDGVPQDLDFFSLDIDSFDFEVAAWALDHGYRPKTVCLEFNHRFGASAVASFPWVQHKGKGTYNKRHLHGVSLAKYQHLWQGHGYRYFGFDSSCVNVFFYDPRQVRSLDAVECLDIQHLPDPQDQVRPVVEQHAYWRDYLDQIYQAL